METSPAERLANLFISSEFLAHSDPTQPDSAGEEISAPTTEAEAKWEIPATAKSPRKIHGPQPKPAAGEDVVSSSEDDDDYVAAFQAKTRIVAKSAKPRSKQQSAQKSTEPLSAADREGRPSPDLPDLDDHGNAALGHFCPLSLVAKFPYKYMTDEGGQVSSHFFANQKLYQRTWDLYYLHPPRASASSQPILLLPYDQVKVLIDDIYATFKIEVSVPSFPFTVSFFDDGTPQPVFLGRTTCRADINDLQDSIPAPAQGYGEPRPDAPEALKQSFQRFGTKFDKVQASRRSKKGANKKKGADHDRFLRAQDVNKQLRRAQRYFGLRPEPYRLQHPPAGMSWEEQSVFIQEQEKKAAMTLEPLNLGKAPPHGFLGQPVIVAIDVESYERAHDIVTEVGVSTLDTLDLVGRELGKNGELWMQQIRSRHFRIKGREIYVNRDFCIGDGDAFDYGQSEWIDLDKIGHVIDSCFEWPFSAPCKDGTADHVQKGPRERTMLLAGHALHGDLTYLSKLNSAVFSAPRELTTTTMQLSSQEQLTTSDPRALQGARICDRIVECLDTSKLYRGLMQEENVRSLVSIMADIDRPALHPHNSGNDARYTLEALIGIAIKSRFMDDRAEAAHNSWDEAAHNNWDAQSAAWSQW
ncbi:hypothetical protein DV737_g2230, partial [Chaetothyriales sp. CBS 132003]